MSNPNASLVLVPSRTIPYEPSFIVKFLSCFAVVAFVNAVMLVQEAERSYNEAHIDDAERFEDAEDSNDEDDEEDEYEEHGEQPEEVEVEEGAAYEIRSTQINIHIHRGGSMYINMMQGGTLHVNVFGEVEGLEWEWR
ncbi:hypothetical protein J4E86_011464 [Alternaria arbusti]|uniref:uncharacterized protein n=1 Tax=Alternaria arbusti TaxID=232088 RepID=UPI0022203889|nr:uncharacterized protein J4E86_011464 [Alternaria arbusti]KAI4934082.1 hypothetical protein J4E86_011464 [Alternaria arbusti]